MIPLRILVVEDHASSNSVLCSVLQHRGHQVTGAMTAREALDAAKTRRFDLVIMDLQLPDDNGWNLFVKLRKLLPGLPAIAFTGHGSEADRKRSEIVGIAAHLLKPVGIGTLEAVIARIFPARMEPHPARSPAKNRESGRAG